MQQTRHLLRLALGIALVFGTAAATLPGSVAAQEKPKAKPPATPKTKPETKTKPKTKPTSAGPKKAAGNTDGAKPDPGKKAGKPGKQAKTERPKKKPRPRATVATDDVYFGDAKTFSKPAEVDADIVYAEIPAYKEVVKLKLKASQPRYQLLMSKASRAFSRAVRKAAKKHGYDLVAKPGSVKGAKEIADITQHVIDAL